MANFRTHLSTASAVSMVQSTICFGAKMASPKEVLLYFSLGTLGGILPDVDSDNSVPLKNLFNFLAIAFAFLAIFMQIDHYSIAEMFVLWLTIFFIIKYLFVKVFQHYTVHRGIFHSIPAAALMGIMTITFCFRVCGLSPYISWMCGWFVFIGYMTHLILDELYSIEIAEAKIKCSFGTACKLFKVSEWQNYLYLMIVFSILYFFAPDYSQFVKKIFSGELFQSIEDNFLPKQQWFANLRFWK